MSDPMMMNGNLRYCSIEEIEECRIHGRNEIVNGALPLFFSRSGIEFITDSTELWVDISTGFSTFEIWIALEINGAFIMRRMLLPGEYPVCLFRGMAAGVEKRIFFYRELQAMSDDKDSYFIIKGLYADGEFKAPPERSLRIEFIGDSITSGEGTYGACGDMDWLPMYMSSSRTYPCILEKELDAEVRVFSQGGWGVYSGWDNDTSHNIPSVYDRVCGFLTGEKSSELGAGKKFVPGNWQPDAVIINLGTNDVSGFDQPPFYDPVSKEYKKLLRGSDGKPGLEDIKKIEEAVVNFLVRIRDLYPDAYILWVYGMAGCELAPYLDRAVKSYGRENNDKNVFYLTLPETEEGEFGSREHPGFLAHKKAAADISEHIKTHICKKD